MRQTHPDSGLHYINVFPRENLVYNELYHLYKETQPWFSTIDKQEFKKCRNELDTNCMVIIWGFMPNKVVPRNQRNYWLVIRYGEQIQVDSIPYNDLCIRATLVDGIFCHSRPAEIALKNINPNSFFTPIGYSEAIYGKPNFIEHKKYDLIFIGGIPKDRPDNRRRKYLPILKERLGSRFDYISGAYSMERQQCSNSSKCILHMSHRCNSAFESMRLWQSIGTSAVMLWEPRDCYPAELNKHYLEIPWMNDDNTDEMVEILTKILDRTDLIDIAKCAHDELSKFTVYKCMEDFVVPASRLIIQ